MKFVVTGATGFIGKKLVTALLEKGHEVSVLSRNVSNAKENLPQAVHVYAWDPMAEPAPVGALTGKDVVIHLAGEGVAEKRWTKTQKEKIRSSRVIGTRNLVATINTIANGPKVLVSASAIGFYGNRQEEILDENSKPGEGFLSEVCQEWEAETRKVSPNIRRAVVRIGIVLGRGGGALKPLIPLFSLGAGGPVANGRQWMSWIHVDDLVSLFIHCAENDSVKGEVNGTAPYPVRNTEFTKALGSALSRPAILPAPAFALKLAMGELSDLVLFSQNVQPKAALASGFHFKYPRVQEALNEISKKKASFKRLIRTQQVALPVEKVFPFFADEKNLETITPPWLNFKVIGKSTPKMQSGTLIDYRLAVHGIPVTWQSVIEDWEPNKRFVDRQTVGPYTLWHHTHQFTPTENGTLMSDTVEYEVPGGAIGNLLLGRFIEKDLNRIFEYRKKQVETLLQSGTST